MTRLSADHFSEAERLTINVVCWALGICGFMMILACDSFLDIAFTGETVLRTPPLEGAFRAAMVAFVAAFIGKMYVDALRGRQPTNDAEKVKQVFFNEVASHWETDEKFGKMLDVYFGKSSVFELLILVAGSIFTLLAVISLPVVIVVGLMNGNIGSGMTAINFFVITLTDGLGFLSLWTATQIFRFQNFAGIRS